MIKAKIDVNVLMNEIGLGCRRKSSRFVTFCGHYPCYTIVLSYFGLYQSRPAPNFPVYRHGVDFEGGFGRIEPV